MKADASAHFNQSQGYSRWTLRDAMYTGCLSVAYGIFFWGVTYLYRYIGEGILKPIPYVGPILKESLVGLWFGAGILVGLLIRKPGAALLGETIAALVGSTLYWSLLDGPVLGAIQGMACEFVFLIGRYRQYRTPTAIFAGIAAALASFAWNYPIHQYQYLPLWLLAGKLCVRTISGALLGGLLAKRIADALQSTGALQQAFTRQEGAS